MEIRETVRTEGGVGVEGRRGQAAVGGRKKEVTEETKGMKKGES